MTDARSRTREEYMRGTGGRRWGRGRKLLVGVLGALVVLAVGVISAAAMVGLPTIPTVTLTHLLLRVMRALHRRSGQPVLAGRTRVRPARHEVGRENGYSGVSVEPSLAQEWFTTRRFTWRNQF